MFMNLIVIPVLNTILFIGLIVSFKISIILGAVMTSTFLFMTKFR